MIPSIIGPFSERASFDNMKEDLRKNPAHLYNFCFWHEKVRSQLGERILSDWSNPFGCSADFSIGEDCVRLVGLNTALLSWADVEHGRLVQDAQTLQELIGFTENTHDWVIAVGHHPLDWLAEWNRHEVEETFRLRRGVDFYLHGHYHTQGDVKVEDRLVSGTKVLRCGAAYPGSLWPQYFCIHRLHSRRMGLETRLFAYSEGTNTWVLDEGRSNRSIASSGWMPDYHNTATPLARGYSAVERDQRREGMQMSTTSTLDVMELRVIQAFNYARQARDLVESYLDKIILPNNKIYSSRSRVRSISSTLQKIHDRRHQGQPDFGPDDVGDMCGFRLVTLFYGDIVPVLDQLLQSVSPNPSSLTPLRAGKGVEVRIFENDDIDRSASKIIQEMAMKSGFPVDVSVIRGTTQYRSIFLNIQCAVSHSHGAEVMVPVEFQLRTALDELWGHIDHSLRYANTKQSDFGDMRLHLEVLKRQFDACASYLQLVGKFIKAGEEEARDSGVIAEKMDVGRSVSLKWSGTADAESDPRFASRAKSIS